jgi:hypothetical protein
MPKFLSLLNAEEPNADDFQAFEASIYYIEPLTQSKYHVTINRPGELRG